MNRPLPLVAERRRPAGRRAVSLGVFEIAIRSVDGAEPVGAARGHQARQGRMPLIARVIGIQAPDAHGACPQAGGEIRYAEVHCLEPAACLRDILHVREALLSSDKATHLSMVWVAASGPVLLKH